MHKAQSIIASMVALLAACGERPSFRDNEQELKPSSGEFSDQPSLDQTVDPGQVVTGPNGEIIILNPDGTQTVFDPAGNAIIIGPDGQPIVQTPTGPGGDATAGDIIPKNNPPPGTIDDTARPDGGPMTETFSQIFAASDPVQESMAFDPGSRSFSHDIRMRRTNLDRSVKKNQGDRPRGRDEFSQGRPGANAEETFEQMVNRRLDILVIVDDSQSMAEEQANMSGKLAPLLSAVAEADWQIAVLTTDPERPCLRGPAIKKTDANAAQTFATQVTAGATAGTNGSANNERGVLTAVRALSGQCASGPFMREGSTLAIVVVTDEDNCSDGNGCPGKPYASANYLLDYLKSIREPGKNARLYGIYWEPQVPHAQCKTAYNQAHIWSNLVAATSGKAGSICSNDYSATLKAVSDDVKFMLNTKFTLAGVPEAGSVKVFINDIEQTTGITVAGKVVDIEPAPPANAKVKIRYTHSTETQRTSFTLTYPPLANTLKVTVDGQDVDASNYTFDSSNLTLTFATPPKPGSKIAIAYTRDTPLKTLYDLGEPYVPGSMVVFVNGEATSDFSEDAQGGLVTFTTPPPEGSEVQFAYTGIGSPILCYPFTTAYDPPRNFVVRDVETGSAVAVAYHADGCKNGIAFAAEDYADGRKIVITYDAPGNSASSIILPQAPLMGKASVSDGTTICGEAEGLKISGKVLNFGNCGFAADAIVTATYDAPGASKSEFVVDAFEIPSDSIYQEWRVYIDDVPTTAYSRSGGTITLSSPPPPSATIKIELIREVN